MHKAKARCARPARPPKPDEKRHRRPADVETGSLERRRLIEAGGDQQSPADPLIAERKGHLGDRAGPDERHWAKAASAENPTQTARYMAAKTDVGARTAPLARAARAYPL